MAARAAWELDRARIRRVYVRAPNWLGDVIMATAAFARIRSYFVDAEIVCGLKRGHRAILGGSKSFDALLDVEKPRGLTGLRHEAAKLRPHRFDLAILFPNSLSSALVCLWAGIPRRLGYTQGRRFLITHGLRAAAPRRSDGKRYGPRREPVPMVLYWGAMLDAAGMPQVDHAPILRVTPEERDEAERLLREYGVGPEDELIVLNPGAAFGSSKLWEPERWARLAELLHEARPAKLLVLVGPGEEELAARIVALTQAPLRAAIEPLVPLGALKPLIDRAALMITTDSGPRHVAVAMRTPHVVLMGPTHPGYTNANLEHATILRRDVDCGPCHLPLCPLDHRCMTGISPDEVKDAALARIRT